MNPTSSYPAPKNHTKGAYLITAVSAITLSNIVKSYKAVNPLQLCLSCVSASFLLAISACRGKKKEWNDRILVFFTDSDKKSIVTLYESQIHKISVTASVDGTGGDDQMVAVLDKVVIGQGRKCRAERKIEIQSYTHAWESSSNGRDKPQVTLVISGRDCKKQVETCFAHLRNKKSLSLVMKTKKYVERTHIPAERSDSFIEKTITLTVDKRSILVKLLELYSRENSVDNLEKAIYFVGRFIHFIPKTVLEHLKKRIKKLDAHTQGTQDVKRLMVALNPHHVPSSHSISDKQMLSLKNDIMALIRERACRYENLYEALSQDTYSPLVSPGIDEIIACYSTKANHPTNSLLKRYISEDKALAAKMKTIHGFIDACKKHSNSKLEAVVLDEKLLQYFPDDNGAISAYESLRSQFTNSNTEEAFCISDAIESARQKVASKYSKAFVGDIIGIAEKTAVNVHKMSVKMEKVKDPDELPSCFTIYKEGINAFNRNGIQR